MRAFHLETKLTLVLICQKMKLMSWPPWLSNYGSILNYDIFGKLKGCFYKKNPRRPKSIIIVGLYTGPSILCISGYEFHQNVTFLSETLSNLLEKGFPDLHLAVKQVRDVITMDYYGMDLEFHCMWKIQVEQPVRILHAYSLIANLNIYQRESWSEHATLGNKEKSRCPPSKMADSMEPGHVTFLKPHFSCFPPI